MLSTECRTGFELSLCKSSARGTQLLPRLAHAQVRSTEHKNLHSSKEPEGLITVSRQIESLAFSEDADAELLRSSPQTSTTSPCHVNSWIILFFDLVQSHVAAMATHTVLIMHWAPDGLLPLEDRSCDSIARVSCFCPSVSKGVRKSGR